MKCCICGGNVLKYGHNPFPLCHKNDFESRCCDACNNMVVKARMILYAQSEIPITEGDELLILYSKKSTLPTDTISTDSFLCGTVESIIQENTTTKYKGTWGNFILDSENDQFAKIN